MFSFQSIVCLSISLLAVANLVHGIDENEIHVRGTSLRRKVRRNLAVEEGAHHDVARGLVPALPSYKGGSFKDQDDYWRSAKDSEAPSETEPPADTENLTVAPLGKGKKGKKGKGMMMGKKGKGGKQMKSKGDEVPFSSDGGNAKGKGGDATKGKDKAKGEPAIDGKEGKGKAGTGKGKGASKKLVKSSDLPISSGDVKAGKGEKGGKGMKSSVDKDGKDSKKGKGKSMSNKLVKSSDPSISSGDAIDGKGGKGGKGKGTTGKGFFKDYEGKFKKSSSGKGVPKAEKTGKGKRA